MRYCPRCGSEMKKGTSVCPTCGLDTSEKEGKFDLAAYYRSGAGENAFDHTREFSEDDVAQNRLYAMLPYLLSVVGIIIALLAAGESPYAAFHVRQAVRITVAEVLIGLIAAVFVWTVLVPLAAGLAIIVLAAVQLAMFVSVCQGRACEPWLIRSIPFLK